MDATTDVQEPAQRVADLRQELQAAGEAFVAAVLELEPLAAELADLEAQLRAAEHRAGIHHYGPTPRELATEVVCGYLHALQPHLRPMTTRKAAERAAKELFR